MQWHIDATTMKCGREGVLRSGRRGFRPVVERQSKWRIPSPPEAQDRRMLSVMVSHQSTASVSGVSMKFISYVAQQASSDNRPLRNYADRGISINCLAPAR